MYPDVFDITGIDTWCRNAYSRTSPALLGIQSLLLYFRCWPVSYCDNSLHPSSLKTIIWCKHGHRKRHYKLLMFCQLFAQTNHLTITAILQNSKPQIKPTTLLTLMCILQPLMKWIFFNILNIKAILQNSTGWSEVAIKIVPFISRRLSSRYSASAPPETVAYYSIVCCCKKSLLLPCWQVRHCPNFQTFWIQQQSTADTRSFLIILKVKGTPPKSVAIILAPALIFTFTPIFAIYSLELRICFQRQTWFHVNP